VCGPVTVSCVGSSLELGILGPLEAVLAGQEPAALGGLRQRALLVVLALHANEVVSSDRLVDLLWGESPPAQAAHTVQVFVSRLRRALGPAADRLVTRHPGYLLNLGADELDADRYERLYHGARSALAAGEPSEAAARLRDAEALWRGPALCEFTYEPFAQATIARLEELHLGCREELTEAELALGRHAEAVSALEALVREQPFRERPRGQLMLALYRCGRQAAALDAFQQTRRALVDELGVEPSSALRELEQAILRQDASLHAPVPAGSGADQPRGAPAVPAAAAAVAAAPPAPSVRATTVDATDAAVPIESTPVAPDIMRKTATVLVARLAAARAVDPEIARGVIATARAAVEKIVSRHGGVIVSGLGGEIISVFGLPLTREDDALRALRAAEELRTGAAAPAGGPASLAVHVGVDTGEVVADAPGDLFGEPLDGAIALSRTAGDDAVLMSDATRRFSANAIRVEPANGGDAFHLRGFIEGAPVLPRRSGGTLIGCADELRIARQTFERVVESGTAHLLTIVGEPGIGKSRLAYELAADLGAATVLMGTCLSYGDGVALWPLREALAAAAGEESRAGVRRLLGDASDAELVADIIAAALGLATPESVGEQVPWAFRRLLEQVTERGPVILILDDAHWSGPALLDLVDFLVDWLMAPVLLLCLGRPELLEARPRWGGGHPRMSSLIVAPMSDEDALRLLESQRGDAALSHEVSARILVRAEGNPLFVEQLLAMSIEDPRWVERPDIPGTMQSLLAARLDRLGPGERAFIERAALIGREFWPAAVAELLPPEARASAEQHLRALVRRGLVQPERSTLAGEDALRFHHILIRDVAYRSTPKALRADLHERFAAWLVGRVEGIDEFVGHHLEQAFRYLTELGGDSDATRTLARRAAEALAGAGRRALARGETNAGVALLSRAAELGDAGDSRRPDVLLDLGSALLESGDFVRAERALISALALAHESRAPHLAARTSIELSYLRALIDPSTETREMLAVAEKAMTVFKRDGDDGGLARAWQHVAEVHWTRSRCAEMEPVLERALRHAEIAGERRQRSQILRDLARATVIGPRPVGDAIERCSAILARAEDDVPLRAVAEMMLAVLEAMSGRFDAARDHHLAAQKRLDEVGLTVTAAVLRMYRAFIELLAGTPHLAIPELVESCTVLERIGERRRLATTAALLARLLYADARYEDAERFTRMTEESVSKDDVVSLVIWRGTLARLTARTGQARRSRELIDSAVTLAAGTDFLILHADALSERADVLALLGRQEEARLSREEAIAVYERKGASAAVARERGAQSAATLLEPLP
jgi:DNA-binding SARP family transcriptional activator